MESYKFYSIIRSVRGWGRGARGEELREIGRGKGREGISGRDGGPKGGESGLIPEEGERRFVFLSLPVYREAFISNPQSPPVINHN